MQCSMRSYVMLLLVVVTIVSVYAHAGHPHDQDVDLKEDNAWESVTTWTLERKNYSMQFCQQGHDAPSTMVLELMPMEDGNAINATMDIATEILHTFSSEDVERQSIDIKHQVLQPSTTEKKVLYQVAFSSKCMNATLVIATSGSYMLLAEHDAHEVAITMIDAVTKKPVEVTSCVEGCEDDHEEHDHDHDHDHEESEDGHDHDHDHDDHDHAHHDHAHHHHHHAHEKKSKSTSSTTASDHHAQSWGSPILASLVISLTSLVGVLILSFDQGRVDVIVEYMTSFAAGCLLGVVVFHLYPEGSSYLFDMDGWVMGTCVLGDIAFSMAMEQVVHMVAASFGADPCAGHAHGHAHGHPHPHSETPKSYHNHSIVLEIQQDRYLSHPSTPVDATAKEPSQPVEWRAKYLTSLKHVEPVAWITAVGDFFHAFTDGVVLAVAFKSCSSSLGWAVALGIVLHEVPHRVGDFFIFLKAGMNVVQALVINFMASLASLIGVIVLLAAGAVSDHTLGFLLAFGTGALLFIAMSELMPPMLAVRDRKRALVHFVAFSVGCILIGLSLLQHVHCDASTGEGHVH